MNLRSTLALLVSVLTLALPAISHALDLPNFKKSTLPQGVNIVLVPDHSLPYLTISFAVPVGSIQDPKGLEGLSFTTASLMRYGTTRLGEIELAPCAPRE